METKRVWHVWVWLVLVGLIIVTLVFKAVQEGWFEPRLPLELNDRPALVFFTLSNGCECQMKVVLHAEAQMADWKLPEDLGLNVIRVDFDLRPDLAEEYGAARAPALLLLNSKGQVVWKQDVGLSDETPLDLDQAQKKIETLMQNR